VLPAHRAADVAAAKEQADGPGNGTLPEHAAGARLQRRRRPLCAVFRELA
jgi:hypothetical protein